MTKKSAVWIALFTVIPIALLVFSYSVWQPHRVLKLIPLPAQRHFDLFPYCDSTRVTDSASSVHWFSSSDSMMAFQYSLGEGYQFPFAGISLLADDSSYFDLSSYDMLKLDISATQGKRLQLFLGLYADGFTKPSQITTYRYLSKDLDLKKNQSVYSIPLEEFTTPTWWYADNKVSEKDFKTIAYDRVKIINIQNCQLIGRTVTDTVFIKDMQFTKNAAAYYRTAVIFLGLWYLVLFLIRYSNRPPKEQIQKVEIHYNPVSLTSSSKGDVQKIIDFISSDYPDPELSLKKIQLATGLAETKISSLLKERFNLSFKQYLNQLRLNEAKRLLADLTLPVSDIAYQVGYGNISHFNRVFKESEGVSPNDFRKTIPR